MVLVVVAFEAGQSAGSAGAAAPALSSSTPTSSPTPHESTPALIETPAIVVESPAGTDGVVAPPVCAYDDHATLHDASTDWASIVLDTTFSLDAAYVPPDLVDTAAAGLNGGHLVRSILVDDLRAMARAAGEAGAALAVQSSYRSYAYQQQTFDHWVRTVGRTEALRTSARPGHSEHQLGTAIDFRSAASPAAPWEYDDWATTDAGAWLFANAWRFGFALSYPRGAFDRSCYAYEPWHYRYVGRASAAGIHASGMTPREWLWGTHPGKRPV